MTWEVLVRSLVRFLCLGILISIISLSLGCNLGSGGTAEITLIAVVTGEGSVEKAVDEDPWESVNISPSSYKMLITDFALERKDGLKVTLIDEESPILCDFTGSVGADGLFLARKAIPTGTYVAYEMSFTYLEMDVLCSFNVPSWSTDAAHALVTATHDAGGSPSHGSYTIRQYFNVDGQFQKRDMVVNAGTEESPNWVWMRRDLEDSEGNRKFFLDQETHPYQGCIDLFADEDFWGANDTLDDEEPEIIIESGNTTGGLDATINNFTVSVPKTLLITVDVTNSFNFYEDSTNSTYYNNTLDFGPSYDEIPIGEGTVKYYGDKGFHPFMPKFNLKML